MSNLSSVIVSAALTEPSIINIVRIVIVIEINLKAFFDTIIPKPPKT